MAPSGRSKRVPDAAAAAAADHPTLSDYEQARLENIRANEVQLKALGLGAALTRGSSAATNSARGARDRRGGGGSAISQTAARRHARSQFFHGLQAGTRVRVVDNKKAGHHNLLFERPSLDRATATVIHPCVWPSTWLEVRLDDCSLVEGHKQGVVKVRTSQIEAAADDI